MAGFADCLTNPGELGIEDAIVAMSSHHAWPPSTAAPEPFQASQQLGELDQHLANRLGEYYRLAQRQEKR